MKKIILLGVLLAFLLILVPPVQAEEISVPSDSMEEVEDPVEPIDQEGQAAEENTPIHVSLFTTVYDFVVRNEDKIILLVGFAASLFMTATEKRNRRKQYFEIAGGQSKLIASQNSVVDAANKLSQKQETTQQQCTVLQQTEEERNKLIGALMVQNTTMLEIITSVYVNSRNLPEGEKELILLKYAKCLSAISDDQTVSACMEAVKNVLSTEEVAKNEIEA